MLSALHYRWLNVTEKRNTVRVIWDYNLLKFGLTLQHKNTSKREEMCGRELNYVKKTDELKVCMFQLEFHYFRTSNWNFAESLISQPQVDGNEDCDSHHFNPIQLQSNKGTIVLERRAAISGRLRCRGTLGLASPHQAFSNL